MSEQVTDCGDGVWCDFCGDDYTTSVACGGLLFGSKATCPKCAPGIEVGAKKFGEEKFIRARCPADMPFAGWVRQFLRAGEPGLIRVMTGDHAEIELKLKEHPDDDKPPFPTAA